MTDWYQHGDVTSAITPYRGSALGFAMRFLKDAGVLEAVIDVSKNKGPSKSGKNNSLLGQPDWSNYLGKTTTMYVMNGAVWSALRADGSCGDPIPPTLTSDSNAAHASQGTQLHLYINIKGQTRTTPKSSVLATVKEFTLHGKSKTGCNLIFGYKEDPIDALEEQLESLATATWPTPWGGGSSSSSPVAAADTVDAAESQVNTLKAELSTLETRMEKVKAELEEAEADLSERKRAREDDL